MWFRKHQASTVDELLAIEQSHSHLTVGGKDQFPPGSVLRLLSRRTQVLSRTRMQIASTTLLFDEEEAGILADKKQL